LISSYVENSARTPLLLTMVQGGPEKEVTLIAQIFKKSCSWFAWLWYWPKNKGQIYW